MVLNTISQYHKLDMKYVMSPNNVVVEYALFIIDMTVAFSIIYNSNNSTTIFGRYFIIYVSTLTLVEPDIH